MRNEAYVRAVNNLEKVAAILSPQLKPDDRATLQFNIFTLKLAPQYWDTRGDADATHR